MNKLLKIALSAMLCLNVCTPFHVLSAEESSVSMEDSELTLNGLYDIHNLAVGKTRVVYVNTYPEENVEVDVVSYDTSKIRVEKTAEYGFCITALETGTTSVVLEGTYEGKTVTETFNVQVVEKEETGTKRYVENINQHDWKFILDKDLTNRPSDGSAPVSDASWESVSVPHCWNNEDGADGGNNYHRGIGWYESKVVFDSETYTNKEVYLEFEGASKVSELYVNGKKAGRHEGGYSIFRFNVTDFIELDKENTITLSVDNRVNSLMPLSGDFTVFGGLYRDVNIIATDKVHIDLDDYGSSGVQVTQLGAKDVDLTTTAEEVFKDGGKLSVDTRITNQSEEEANVKTKTVVYDADWNKVTETSSETTIDANTTDVITQELTVANPHLWDGVNDPYLYNVVVEVYKDNELFDRQSERLGFRFYCVDREKGFYLNGNSYPLRGVNSHQDRAGKGYAATKADRDQDMALMSAIGANTIRFAHYQHDQYVYDLADEMGITVWAEIPLVNGMVDSDAFRNSTKNNLRELINQSYNHASIVVWGIHNEQWPNNGGRINTLLRDLYDIAHEEDPSRLVTVATAQSEGAALSWQSDVSAWNKYFGLYEAQDVRYFGTWLDQVKKYADTHESISVKDESTQETIVVPVSGKIGMSEYGVGSNIAYHEENPGYRVGTGFDAYQSEEFQSQWHEIYYEAIDEREWVWGTYVWNMFEFGSDSRSEAGRKGINNKGMVSYDRETKKDVFYFYQANWAKDAMIHINSKRFTDRYQDDIKVKVYSNLDDVELFVNGVSQGVIQRTDTSLNRFEWNIKLSKNDNTVVAVGHKDGKQYVDEVHWNRVLHKEPNITSSMYNFNNENEDNRTVSGVMDQTSIKEFKQNVTLHDGTTLKFFDENGNELVEETAGLRNGMKIHAISEDLSTTYIYTIVSQPISQNKPVFVEDEKAGEPKENLVDGDTKTAYNSGIELSRKSPQQVIIDLGQMYQIYDTNMLWWDHSSVHRTFTYNIKISNDKENWTTVKENVQSPSQEEGARWSNNNFNELLTARYVMIEGIKSTSSYASMYLYEAIVNGFALESDVYTINNETCVIRGLKEDTTVEEFLNNIRIDGTYDAIAVVDHKGDEVNGIVDSTMSVKVSADQKEVIYTFAESGSTEVAISRNKKVTALDAVDKDGVTKPNEDVLEGETDASHGKNYAPAKYMNDGNMNTRWSGAMNAAHNTAIFPAVVVMDLGQVYNLNHMMLQFYAGSTPHNPGQAPNRYYNYRIYAANEEEVLKQTNIDEQYLIVDGTNNINEKKSLIEKGLQAKGRYVAIEVMKNSTGTSYHSPSVWEMEIEGYRFAGMYEVDEENRIIKDVEGSTCVADFISNLGIDGNYTAAVVLDGKEYASDEIIGKGCVLQVRSLDGNAVDEYEIAFKDTSSTPLSQGKHVTALDTETAVDGKIVPNEDKEKGFVATNINDGNVDTRWSGVMNKARTQSYYPASVHVDLTNAADTDDWYYLTGVDLTWFNSANKRAYQYELHAINPVGIAGGWDLEAKDNQTQDHTEHWVDGKSAQIKDMTIKVTGSTLNQSYIPAVVKEMKVYGWRLHSDGVDEASETVYLPKEDMNVSQVLSFVNALGNCTVTIVNAKNEELAYTDKVDGTCSVVVRDIRGQEFIYDVKAFGDSADKTALETLVEEASTFDESLYTEASWADFTKAFTDAETVLVNEEATQEEVDEAVENLGIAMANLEKSVYTVTVNGEVAATGAYNEKVTVTAPVVEGQTFTAWLFEGKVISTEEMYTFFLSQDMDLVASYEEVNVEAQAILTNTILTKRDTKADVKFVAQLVVPTGYTVKDAGLVWSSKEDTVLDLDNAKATYITRISNTNQFSVTIKGMPAGRFIRGKIFATLVDNEGNETVVYSQEARVVNK